ncbi:lipoxygenase homology domain-containing protein 1-like [Amphiura filiformis]|uniref:lipoxygenase homology domain-containing protein 1-like n=1 Tax=Amphiura filiformis TaxID=82378 RepID=UPI003B20C4A2
MGFLLDSTKIVFLSCLFVLCLVELNSAYPNGGRDKRDAIFKEADLEEETEINLQTANDGGGGVPGWLIAVIIVLVFVVLILVLVAIWVCIRCVCSQRVEDSLKNKHSYKTLRNLQKIRALKYEKETIVIPELNIVHSSVNGVSVTPELENFPDVFNVKVYYTIEKQQKLGPFEGGDNKHELPLANKQEPKRVTADAADPYGYKAQCSFAILEGPIIEPINNHSRTSASTATVRMVECSNFRSNTPVQISYFDGDAALGEFPADGEHKLQKLKRTTKDVKAKASDEVGNVAETTFEIDQKIPTVSYQRISRTPTSIIVKGVALEHFPNMENAIITYTSEGHEEHQASSDSAEHEVADYGQSFQGKILAKATDTNQEYIGECEIKIDGPGPMINPIAEHSRTSISTATIRQVTCSYFPAAAPVQITYYDGEESLGEFPAEEDHRLSGLKMTSQDIKVKAADDLGNIAETSFTVDQNIPMIAYERVSRTPKSLVVKGVKLENFPNKDFAVITYSCEGHGDQKAKGSIGEHELAGYSQSWEGGVVRGTASYGNEYTAECQISIEGPGPMIEPVTNQSRTSVSTATVRQVQCKNFPADSLVQFTYYDGDKSLGNFPAGQDHKLTNLKKTTEEIKIKATDDFGNIAETSFTVDQNMPSVSYENIFRTTKAIFIKGVKLENFPDGANATVTYSSEGHDDHQCPSSSEEHEVPGYRPSWEGVLIATATDETKEYTGECKINIEVLMETYHIYVTTSDKRGAGTDANVHIVLYGDNDDTGQIALEKSSSNMNKFERGNTDEFHVKAVQVGEIPKIRIGHDNKGGFAGWMLDRVEIEAPSLSTRLYFPCGRWFDKKEDDGEIERELPAVERKMDTYHIYVTTSDKKGAGTDANVYIDIHGEEGETGQQFLKSSKTNTNKFERGEMDEFEIEAIKIGGIKKIIIGHDNKGAFGAGWMLDKVEIESPQAPGKRLYFPCGRWLDKKEDDGLIERELIPMEREMETYNIFVTTSDKKGAGTDANVYINLFGEDGDTGETFLEKSKNNKNKFERGDTDEFEVKIPKVGAIQKIKIGHDNKGGFAGWMLDRVEIEAPSLGLGTRLLFPCGRWLDKKEDDGLIERELTPVERQMETYKVFVTTSDVKGAGTDANVYVIIHGDEVDTGKQFLKSSKTNKNKFETGQTDEFEVEAIEVGDITKIKIGHDNAGGFAGWMLDRVEIESPSTHGKRLYFSCGRWFDTDKEDGAIERELIPLEHGMETYNIFVTTADEKGAGTDANVYIIIYGEHGDTGRQFLKKSKTHKDKFEKGNTDEFDLETGNVGEIKNIRIGHDNKDTFGAAWMVDNVEIEAPSIGKRLHFPCGQWFDKKKGDGQIERLLAPGEKGAKLAKPETETYNIFVTTSDVKNAGTDANVHIIIYGDDIDTGKLTLKKSKTHKDKFERGNMDEFEMEAPKVGDVKKIRIGHDNKGAFGGGWMLDNVELESPSTLGKRLHFACGRWLDKKEDDGLIERELVPKDASTNGGTVDTAGPTGDAQNGGAQTREPETYEVFVTTSDKKGAGTDANVYVIICGEHGDTGQQWLTKSKTHKDKFEQGNTDHFVVDSFQLGKIKSVKIGHDNKGGFAGWMLDNVEVESPSIGKRLYFPCDRWLDKKEDDGAIERELLPVEIETYKIFVTTSNDKNSGTDANVHIYIYGENGETEKIPLKKSKTHRDKFERGNTDEFEIDAKDVGDITKIKIGHDNKGAFGGGWKLDNVEVETSLGTRKHFACGRWLDKKEDDKKIERELTPS